LKKSAIAGVLFKAVAGLVVGLVYYVVYVVLIPLMLGSVTPLHREALYYLGLLLTLSTASSVLSKHVVSIPLKILVNLLAALILYTVLNGGKLSVEVSADNQLLVVNADISPILYLIVLASIILGFIDAINYFKEHSIGD